MLQNYKPVTAERLKKPEDGDWLMVRRTYDGWGYSPLDQITPGNVARLQPAWVVSTGVNNGHEAAPIVNNGVMFVATPGNQVIALDARDPAGSCGATGGRCRKTSILLHPTSRGVALFGDKVFFAAGDAVLVALDARTGREVWTTKVEENRNGYYMSLAPLVADGKVMVGASGGELGIRGFVAAFDLDTGKPLWKVVQRAGAGRARQRDVAEGRPVEDRRRLDLGERQLRSGDEPGVIGAPATAARGWAISVPATTSTPRRRSRSISPPARSRATSNIIPNDSWDWDEVSPPILVDYTRNGRTIKGLIDVARDGYLWFLERTDGRINFVQGVPFVKQNVFTSTRSQDRTAGGRSGAQAGHRQEGGVLPVAMGRQELAADRLQPEDADDLHPGQREPLLGRDRRADRTTGRASASPAPRHGFSIAPGADHIGEVQAWNVDTGKRVWTHQYKTSPNWGPMLATAGGVVFSGGTNDQKFHAFDASSGKLLWEFPTSSGIIGQPSSFMVERQAVRRGSVRLGHRLEGDADAAQRGVAGELPRSAGGRRDLGVRGEVETDGNCAAHLRLIIHDERLPGDNRQPRGIDSLGQLTGADSGFARFRCPELYYREAGGPPGQRCHSAALDAGAAVARIAEVLNRSYRSPPVSCTVRRPAFSSARAPARMFVIA